MSPALSPSPTAASPRDGAPGLGRPRALPGIANVSQKLSPPSPSTKPEARKDKIVVEVKSDKVSEEAGLLQGANGERRAAADQVGQSAGHRQRRSGRGCPQVTLCPPCTGSILHQQRFGGLWDGGEGTILGGNKALLVACPAWLCLLPWSSSQAPQGPLGEGTKMGKIWQRSLARSQSRGCRNGPSEPEIFGMSLLGRVLSPHLGCSSFSQRHCWATTVHGSHKMQPLSLLWFYLPGESPCLALHSSQSPPWGAPAVPHPTVCVTTRAAAEDWVCAHP